MQQLLEDHSGRCLLQAAVEFAADLGAAVGKDVLRPVRRCVQDGKTSWLVSNFLVVAPF